MSIAATIRKLIADGFTVEQALAAAEAFEASMTPERTARQDRNARYYQKRASEKRLKASETSNSDERVLTKTPSREPTRVEDNLLPKKISGQEENKKDKPQAAKTPRSELLVVLDEERADALIEHRHRLRKPMTAHAAHLLAGKLSQCPNPNEAADAIIANGWQGFEVSWLDKPKPRSGAPPNGRMSAVETNMARRMRKDEPGSGRRDNGDVELLPPDKPELRSLIRDAGQAMRVGNG